MDIYGKYDRPKSKDEPGGGKSITETAGYIPVKIQVEQMILAGKRLGDWREENYDFGAGVEVPPNVQPDPTRSPSFDLADGSQGPTVKEAVELLNRKFKQQEAAKVTKVTEDPKENDNGIL